MPADNVHVLAFDHRGQGEADKLGTGYSLAALGQDVVAFLDAVGLSSAVLPGSSSGGYVAQQVAAATSPHRGSGLVLVSSRLRLQGRPPFADDVDELSDLIDATWVTGSLTLFPRFQPVRQW